MRLSKHTKRTLLFLLFFSLYPANAQSKYSIDNNTYRTYNNSVQYVARINDKATVIETSTNTAIKRNLIYHFETVGVMGSGKHAPFWHTSNHQGMPSVNSNNGFMHIAAIGSSLLPSGFGVDYGIDLGLGANYETDLFVNQLYFDFNYKCLGLEVGIKERWNDKNCDLSSGALTWSGNSKPIPEIRAGILDYARLPIIGRWLAVKGHIGYGRLTDDRWRKEHYEVSYMDQILFHSKDFFLKIGDAERFPLEMTIGIEMNNMFGGTYHKGSAKRKIPSDLDAYWKALFPFHRIEEQGDEDGDNVGSWHLNLDYCINGWRWGVYYEHFFEDHSSMLGVEYKYNTNGEKEFIYFGLRRNWFDGLWGIELNALDNNKFLHNIVLEFMNTRGQCGPICHSASCNSDGMYVIEEVDGRDGMYNHNQYSSYSFWGYAIGNPVLVSPAYNTTTGGNRFRSNRVQMFHVGIDGSITKKVDYRILATTTNHWGCYGKPLNEVERITSFMLEFSYWFGDEYDWKVSMSGAADYDSGDLLGNNKGLMFTVSKRWKVL